MSAEHTDLNDGSTESYRRIALSILPRLLPFSSRRESLLEMIREHHPCIGFRSSVICTLAWPDDSQDLCRRFNVASTTRHKLSSVCTSLAGKGRSDTTPQVSQSDTSTSGSSVANCTGAADSIKMLRRKHDSYPTVEYVEFVYEPAPPIGFLQRVSSQYNPVGGVGRSIQFVRLESSRAPASSQTRPVPFEEPNSGMNDIDFDPSVDEAAQIAQIEYQLRQSMESDDAQDDDVYLCNGFIYATKAEEVEISLDFASTEPVTDPMSFRMLPSDE